SCCCGGFAAYIESERICAAGHVHEATHIPRTGDRARTNLVMSRSLVSRLRSTLVVAGLALSACSLFGDDRQTDGEVCSVDDDCSTGVCTSAQLCSHSRCECPSGNCAMGGEQTSDCLDGWVCVEYDSIFDPVK